MRKHVLSAAFLGLAGAAFAQTYSVEPGLWEMKGNGVLAGIDIPFDTTDCITSEESEMNVAEILSEDLGADCTFAGSDTEAFTLECRGRTAISVRGEISVMGESAILAAQGTVDVDGTGALPASIEATAKRIGSCS